MPIGVRRIAGSVSSAIPCRANDSIGSLVRVPTSIRSAMFACVAIPSSHVRIAAEVGYRIRDCCPRMLGDASPRLTGQIGTDMSPSMTIPASGRWRIRTSCVQHVYTPLSSTSVQALALTRYARDARYHREWSPSATKVVPADRLGQDPGAAEKMRPRGSGN